MDEWNEMDCDDLADVAAELALGGLTGRERAQAVAHLQGCGACRASIRPAAVTAEDLLALLPPGEPPAGFETQVMSRLGSAGPHRRRRQGARWLLAAAAGTVIAVAGGLAGWGTHGTTPAPPTAASRMPSVSSRM